MARRRQKTVNKIETLQPDELNELRRLTLEYIERREVLEGAAQGIKEDLVTLDEEYEEKLDLPTLKLALRALKLENQVAHRDAFDAFMEALRGESDLPQPNEAQE